MKINFRQNSYSNKQNFNGTYVVQIPHKAFSNPDNIKECSKFVGNSIGKYMMDSKLGQKFYKFLRYFQSKVFCYPEKFSYMFSKIGMEENGLKYSLQWFRMNTELPIADILKEGYHSFFVFTGNDMRYVLKQLIKVGGDTDYSRLVERYNTNLDMLQASMNAKTGVELDKAMKSQYENAPVYQIENLSELCGVAQKIKQADNVL